MSTESTRRRLGAFVAALAVVTLAAAAAAGAARAGTGFVYTDAAGDNYSAPDIQQVVLTDNGDGTVGVEVDLAAALPGDDSFVGFMIDADRNRQTGNSLGAEYAVDSDVTGAAMTIWDGEEWVDFDHHPLAPALDGGKLTFTLTLSDIGVTRFDFIVGGLSEDDIDAAPEEGAFSYPQAPAQPTIEGITLAMRALFPKAGKTLNVAPSVQLRLSTDEIVGPDSLTCTLTNKGKRVKPAGDCSWKLAKTLKGKTLTLKLTAGYQGETRTVTLPVKPG
jgi:hypothetical protein